MDLFNWDSVDKIKAIYTAKLQTGHILFAVCYTVLYMEDRQDK